MVETNDGCKKVFDAVSWDRGVYGRGSDALNSHRTATGVANNGLGSPLDKIKNNGFGTTRAAVAASLIVLFHHVFTEAMFQFVGVNTSTVEGMGETIC
eukprot:scaffold164830_cov53-Attheya_sp.AAC.4